MAQDGHMVEKVRKCFALALDANAADGEVANAAHAAIQLMRKHGISLNDLAPPHSQRDAPQPATPTVHRSHDAAPPPRRRQSRTRTRQPNAPPSPPPRGPSAPPPPPPDDTSPFDAIMPFGKYASRTLFWILQEDVSYFQWMVTECNFARRTDVAAAVQEVWEMYLEWEEQKRAKHAADIPRHY